MQLIREYLIEMESEYDDQIWGPEKKVKFFLAGHHSMRTTTGVVKGLPLEHYGPKGPRAETGEYDPGCCIATAKGRYFWEASINDKLEIGDHVWFAMNANIPENLISKDPLQIKVRPHAIMAYSKGESPVPYAGMVFIKRDKASEGKVWTPQAGKVSDCEGEVVCSGIPLTGQGSICQVGDKVRYDAAYNHVLDLPGFGFVAAVPHTKILFAHDRI
jgi:hypothetical protein